MKRMLLSIGLLVLLAACASAPAPPPPLTKSEGRHPQLGEEAQASPGAVLFSEWNFAVRPVAIFSTDGTAVSRTGIAPDGTESYCSVYGQVYDNDMNDYINLRVCYFSSDGKNFDSRQYLDSGDGKVERLAHPIPFTQDGFIGNGFKYELVYDGMGNKSLKLTYREYRKAISMPSYTYALSYPVSAFPVTIDIAKIHTTIEVLGIKDNVLRYKVLSSFLTSSQGQPEQQPAQ